MARIRSIHPDQWCDEEFVELPMEARLLAIGLRNFADDKGIFEWKPKTIKMKIFPADDVDVDASLDALLMQNQCIKFTSNGKTYGAIKNFLKFQRPKNPNNIHPISKAAAQYVGYEGEITAEIDSDDVHQMEHQCGNDAEKAIQMEEGGGSSKEVDKSTSRSFSEFWSVWPNKVAKQAAEKSFRRLKPDAKAAAIDGVEDWFRLWRQANPKASAIHATTYLNNARWEDDFSGSNPTDPGEPRQTKIRSDGQMVEFQPGVGWQEVHA